MDRCSPEASGTLSLSLSLSPLSLTHSLVSRHLLLLLSLQLVVDFYAQWCGPCKVVAPKIVTLAGEHPDVSFVKVDVDELEDIAGEQGISAMPTFKFFKNGQVQKDLEVVGASIDAIKTSVTKLKSR